MNILDFGRRVLGMGYSPLQETILLASRGEVLTDAQAALFERHAGRAWPGPGEPPHEVHLVTGRQSGKTGRVGATLSLEAAFNPATTEGLEPGYSRHIATVAPTRRQARIAYDRVRALVQERPALRVHLEGEPTNQEISLDFGIKVGVWAARGAYLRGLQARLLLLDEAAFLPAEGPRADLDLIEAVRPGMAMVPNAQIVCITSPWAQVGYVFEAYRRRSEFADVFVFQAASWELNPAIPQRFLDRERARDPELFQREYGGEFVSTISAYLPAASIEACVVSGRKQLPAEPGKRYVCAIDQAYRQDRFALAVGHQEGDRVVVDLLHSWIPGRGRALRLESLLPELKALIQPYGINVLLGDQFAADAFREVLRREGMDYGERTFTTDSKRNMYASLKAGIVGEAVELLDHDASLRELRTLEARVTPAGNVRIAAPEVAGFHDDFADVLAILVHELRPTSDWSFDGGGWYQLARQWNAYLSGEGPHPLGPQDEKKDGTERELGEPIQITPLTERLPG